VVYKRQVHFRVARKPTSGWYIRGKPTSGWHKMSSPLPSGKKAHLRVAKAHLWVVYKRKAHFQVARKPTFGWQRPTSGWYTRGKSTLEWQESPPQGGI